MKWGNQSTQLAGTHPCGVGGARAVGMLRYVLATPLGSEIRPRERKNSDVDDSGGGSLSGYCWHALQR